MNEEERKKQWYEISIEVDRLYQANLTPPGRVACITDYIVRLVNAAPRPGELEELRALSADGQS